MHDMYHNLKHYNIISTLYCSNGTLVCASHGPDDTFPLIHTLIREATTIVIKYQLYAYKNLKGDKQS